MSFNDGKIARRAAKQPWWIMPWAAAGMQLSRPGSCWQQVRAGSCSPAMRKWQSILLLVVGACSPAPVLHGSCWAEGMHAEQQKCHRLVARASIHASTQDFQG